MTVHYCPGGSSEHAAVHFAQVGSRGSLSPQPRWCRSANRPHGRPRAAADSGAAGQLQGPRISHGQELLSGGAGRALAGAGLGCDHPGHCSRLRLAGRALHRPLHRAGDGWRRAKHGALHTGSQGAACLSVPRRGHRGGPVPRQPLAHGGAARQGRAGPAARGRDVRCWHWRAWRRRCGLRERRGGLQLARAAGATLGGRTCWACLEHATPGRDAAGPKRRWYAAGWLD
eukprot:SAG22_NODE_88_length_21409_cov_11.207180_15_plen_229_part_00